MDHQRRRIKGCSSLLYCLIIWWWSPKTLSSQALSFVMGSSFVLASIVDALSLVAKLFYIAMDLDHAIRIGDAFCYGMFLSVFCVLSCINPPPGCYGGTQTSQFVDCPIFYPSEMHLLWHILSPLIDDFWSYHQSYSKNGYDRFLTLHLYASHMGPSPNGLKNNG
jgi:hypothetical protein